MNHTAEIITGWKFEDVVNKSLTEVFNKKDFKIESLPGLLKTLIKDGTVIDLISENSILISKDGTEIPVSDSSFARIMDQKGNIPGAVIVFRDITKRSQVDEGIRNRIIELEQQLNERTEQLEVVKREMEEFRGK
ncbi:MAG TPA: PAS domain S-box protein [Candidatus Methanoperedens sp.]